MKFEELKQKKLVLSILFFFALIYCLISIVNHYKFRTYALDLGLYSNLMYDYSHFRMSHYSIVHGFYPHNPLADHCDLLIPLLSPLYWLFGTYTLLIIQIAAILFGGYGVYIYFKERTDKKFLPELAMIHFFCIWGIYSALAYDYHSNVVGAMFVPWLLHYFDKRNYRLTALFFILLIFSKENMSLWAVFIFLGLIFLNRKDKSKMKAAFIFLFISAAYFTFIMEYLMPALSGDYFNANNDHYPYPDLGSNFGAIVTTIFTRPLYVIKLLFTHTVNYSGYDGIKKEMHLMVLFSGGYALLFRPQYLVMLIPIYGQKLFSNSDAKWGINAQYSIEFVPILTIALFTLLMKIKTQERMLVISTNLTLLTGFATFSKLEHRTALYHSPQNVMFYDDIHYHTDFTVYKVHDALKLIPPDAIVCAQTQLVPHLSGRPYIYQFPDVYDADYIALLDRETTYPRNRVDYDAAVNSVYHSPDWEVIYQANYTCILKRVRNRFCIKASNGLFVSADRDLGGALIANRTKAFDWEKFRIFKTTEGKYKVSSDNHSNVRVASDSTELLLADTEMFTGCDQFSIEYLGHGKFAARAYNNKYVSVNHRNNDRIEATSDTIGINETFSLSLY